ncbi:MAG TPA: lysine 5,6-aminomutase subunit alpha, partial [Anaeromyxobacteraceae bacterium]|nr:lysine 5,6-aminomutase subunit alpha [Anaeromyxobacteraceae bacterium]
MRLPDGREVPDLHLDPEVVARCRALADRVTGEVMEFIGRHTTVSIERTVLRQLGFHDAGPRGVPLVNLMVDALQERGLLGRGAAWWFGWALRQGARDPLQVVDRITALPRQPVPLPEAEDRALREEVRAEVRAAAAELRRRVESRDALRSELGTGPAP